MSGFPLRRGRIARIIVMLMLIAVTAQALPIQPPQQYFTNLAERLLLQQFGLRLTNVQIAPSNTYDSAVHRVFQVSANICEAMSTNAYPLVFRPLFTTNQGAVFLSGFKCDNSRDTIGQWLESNPYGVPLVIGARKGFPSFNEFTSRSDALITRKLQLVRPTTNSLPTQTNQMYALSFSNRIFVESWNSYSNSFASTSGITISNYLTVAITNTGGILFSGLFVSGIETNIDVWPGTFDSAYCKGFKLPLVTNYLVLSNAAYRFERNRFEPSTNNFEILPGFPLPEWALCVSNHLVYFHSVGTNLIDCVVVHEAYSHDLISWLSNAPSPFTFLGSVWNTNRSRGSNGPTEGIRAQVDFSLRGSISQADWLPFSDFKGDPRPAVSIFTRFMLGYPDAPLKIEVPFSPVARLARIKTFQVNDPFVRSHPVDLDVTPPFSRALLRTWDISASGDNPSSETNLNQVYSPWFGNPFLSWQQDTGDPATCDPGIRSSDYWNFPTNETPRIEWLGRVHRGTPWQSIYLKPGAAPMTDWLQRHRQPAAHPTNDWSMALYLAAEWDTNAPATRISINSTNLAAWTAVFSGLTVLSNVSSHGDPSIPATQQSIKIVAGDPQIETIVEGMNRARSLEPNQYFRDVTRWLRVPELTYASPWVDQSDIWFWYETPDEVYEALPSQLFARVRPDPVASLRRDGPGFAVEFTGCIESAYAVQSSSDLASWTPLPGRYTPTNGVFQVLLEASPGARFFRAIAE